MENQAKSKKPFYKRWWFIAVCVVVGIGVIVNIFGGGTDTPSESPTQSVSGVPATPSNTPDAPTESPSSTPLESESPEPSPDVAAVTTGNDEPNATTGQKNALNSAKQYLSFSAFSHTGLIKQLEFEKYSTEEATYGADNCGADWNEQAVKSAKQYLGVSAFSYTGLIKQLEFEGFTNEQAVHGADNCAADWKEQAAKSAKTYLDISSFSRDSLIQQLEFEGFTNEQAVYGVEQNGY